jgi:hypothetical protein
MVQLTQSVLKINFKIVSLYRTETKAKWRHLKKTFLQNIFGGKKNFFGGPEIREEDGVVLQPVFFRRGCAQFVEKNKANHELIGIKLNKTILLCPKY